MGSNDERWGQWQEHAEDTPILFPFTKKRRLFRPRVPPRYGVGARPKHLSASQATDEKDIAGPALPSLSNRIQMLGLLNDMIFRPSLCGHA